VSSSAARECAYGAWPSELSSLRVASATGLRFSGIDLSARRLRWVESRAGDGGRCVVVEETGNGSIRELTPAEIDVRTRAHEYGGAASWYSGQTAFCSHFADGRVYRIDGSGSPRPITPEPSSPQALRYADGRVSPDGTMCYCVRERYEGGEPISEIIAVRTDGEGEPEVIASGRDFFAAPRIDPSGRRLAWLAWDHPNMPWDTTELWECELAETGLRNGPPTKVAGAEGESIIEPAWSPDGVLHFCSDRNGWWNLFCSREGEQHPLTHLSDGEIGGPSWWFGLARYTFLDSGAIVCVVTRAATDNLELLAPNTGRLESLDLEWTAYLPCDAFSATGDRVAFAAASAVEPTTIVELNVSTMEQRRVRRSMDDELEPSSLSAPQAIAFQTRDGETSHAFYYPPRNADYAGPADERPPLRVICHGGPTHHTPPGLDLQTQFFTQRGIAVLAVNYRGSSGFGRDYRRALDGRWGEIDWQDCVDAKEHLVAAGTVDGDRTWVEGTSAGGYVVLCAVAFEPTAFSAGVSYYGISDIEAFATETHKLESHYCDTIVGPYPERADLYRQRSPIHFVDQVSRPLLLLQGLEDKVVPPPQAELMAAALESKGIPHAYLAYAGQGHGFTRLDVISQALDATLSFAGEVLRFQPAGEIEPVQLSPA
jgi:dipeptidyl aminopeptidase/acylaminoacyl peptidase